MYYLYFIIFTDCQSIASPDGDYVTLGLHKLSIEDDNVGEFSHLEHIPIKQTVIHPCHDDYWLEYDFMVSELEWSTTKYEDYVVDLDTPSDDFDLDDGELHELAVIGFGSLFSGHPGTPNVLQEVY